MTASSTIWQRPATAEDLEFLWHLHIATMKDYVEKTWGWDEEFQAAHFHKTNHPEKLKILTFDGLPIGVLETHLHPDHLFLARISIHPSHQQRGHGTTIIRAVCREAAEMQLPLRLQVLKVNPACHLYLRLGFTTDRETTTHFGMIWQQTPTFHH